MAAHSIVYVERWCTYRKFGGLVMMPIGPSNLILQNLINKNCTALVLSYYFINQYIKFPIVTFGLLHTDIFQTSFPKIWKKKNHVNGINKTREITKFPLLFEPTSYIQARYLKTSLVYNFERTTWKVYLNITLILFIMNYRIL